MSLNFLVYNEREAHSSDIFSITTNGDSIISTGADGAIKQWDPTTNELTGTIEKAFETGGHSVASSQSSTIVGVGFTGDLKCFHGTNGTVTKELAAQSKSEEGTDWVVAQSPDGSTIATTTSTGYLKVYDLESAELVASIATRGKFGMCIDYAANNRSIATGHSAGGLFIFDTEAGKLEHSLAQSDTIRGLCFSPDSESIAVTGDARVISLFDVRTGEQISQLSATSSASLTCIDYNASGELLVTGSIDGKVKVWHVARKECVGTFTESVGHKIWSVKWCKMGPNRLDGFIVGGSQGLLRFYLPTST